MLVRLPTRRYTLCLISKDYCVVLSWNMPLTLPINYPSLPMDARLVITLWDIEKAGKGVPVGGSCLFLFSDKGYVLANLDEHP